jgi:hypothetical protein
MPSAADGPVRNPATDTPRRIVTRGLALCDVCEDPLTNRTARGERPELVVDRTRGPVAEDRRQWIEEIEFTGARATERVLNVRQF